MKTVKIDKRACRKAGAEPLRIPHDNGMLYAEGIQYIVRSMVKNIAHRRVLVLCFYDRAKVLDGDMMPFWRVYQTPQDYITLERLQSGKTKWRSTTLAWLLGYQTSKCGFFSLQDMERVTHFCRNRFEGFHAIEYLQTEILENRSKERLYRKDKKILERMAVIPSVPRGFNNWMAKNIVPAYLFYDYQRNNKSVKAFCTRCRKTVTVCKPKHKTEILCPHCKRPAVLRARGRSGNIYDQTTCCLLQKTSNTELIVRIFKVSASYAHSDIPQIHAFENARQFCIALPEQGFKRDSFYYSYTKDKGLTHWANGDRPCLHRYYYHYENDTCGHIYWPNLKRELAGTPWQYCPLEQFYRYDGLPMQVDCFLKAFIKHPKMEHLLKAGFYDLVCRMVYGRDSWDCIDGTQNRLNAILQVRKEDVPFLRSIQVKETQLKLFQKYSQQNLRDRQRLLQWCIENNVSLDLSLPCTHTTVYKLIRYLEGQFTSMHGTSYRFGSMESTAREYNDYLEMCRQMGDDVKNSFVLFPKNCVQAHDKIQRRLKLKMDAVARREFKRAYALVQKNLDFESDGMKILYPANPEEIVAEGQALHHCVGSYVDRVARKECLILFLRKAADMNRPFYTIEVKNGKVVQVRGFRNEAPTPEVKNFMDIWEHRVLQKAVLPEAA